MFLARRGIATTGVDCSAVEVEHASRWWKDTPGLSSSTPRPATTSPPTRRPSTRCTPCGARCGSPTPSSSSRSSPGTSHPAGSSPLQPGRALPWRLRAAADARQVARRPGKRIDRAALAVHPSGMGGPPQAPRLHRRRRPRPARAGRRRSGHTPRTRPRSGSEPPISGRHAHSVRLARLLGCVQTPTRGDSGTGAPMFSGRARRPGAVRHEWGSSQPPPVKPWRPGMPSTATRSSSTSLPQITSSRSSRSALPGPRSRRSQGLTLAATPRRSQAAGGAAGRSPQAARPAQTRWKICRRGRASCACTRDERQSPSGSYGGPHPASRCWAPLPSVVLQRESML